MEFKKMCELIPPQEKENFKIVHKTANEDEVKLMKLRSLFNRNTEYLDFESGTYVQLIDKNNSDIVMSDTQMEKNTNREFLRMAEGNVLIAGLGIGLIILPLQEKEDVKSILIIEKYQEVIDLILPNLPLNNKVKVICADIFEWLPDKKDNFDTIYFDIWNNICGDNYPEIKELHKRFRKFLNKENPAKWMDSWRRKDFMRLNKQ